MNAYRKAPWTAALALALAACGGDSPAAGVDVLPPAAEAAVPSAGDTEYSRLTAAWSPQALEGCGRTLKETLGTRDLVQGALDGVSDPAGKATAELEDARHWMDAGDAHLAEIRPRLEAGECDGNVNLTLDEAVQAFVKAGTAAVQAGQIAGS